MADDSWRMMWEAKVKQPCDMDIDQLRAIVDKAKSMLGDIPPGIEPTQEHATLLKQFCDENYGRNWITVMGRNFGLHAIHDAKHFAFFYIGEVAVLVSRTQ